MKRFFLILAILVLGGGGCDKLGARTEDSGFQKKSVSNVVSSQTDTSVTQIIPSTDNTVDLGTSSYRWRNVNTVSLTATNATITNLTAGVIINPFIATSTFPNTAVAFSDSGYIKGASDFTYNSSTKALTIGGSATTTIYGNGATSTFGGPIKPSNLTAGRVLFVAADGTIRDSAEITWDGTSMLIGGDQGDYLSIANGYVRVYGALAAAPYVGGPTSMLMRSLTTVLPSVLRSDLAASTVNGIGWLIGTLNAVGSDDTVMAVYNGSANYLLTVMGDGKIGVGTTTPQSMLQIATPSSSVWNYLQIDSEAGAPAAGDCDNVLEQGRMVVDQTNNRLYVCNQNAGRGWDYISLTD